jgi:glycerol-3-phosphate cytidylyltransferase
MKEGKVVITYGTFDLFHIGHLNILKRAKELGDYLVVAVSTDEFNEVKGKRSFFSFEDRSRIVASCRYVDEVIPECDWSQKEKDIDQHNVSVFVMGEDWIGKFDHLSSRCSVQYLQRTPGISSSQVRMLSGAAINNTLIQDLRSAAKMLGGIVERFENLQ